MSVNTLVPFWNIIDMEEPIIISLEIMSSRAGLLSLSLAKVFEKILMILGKQSHLHLEAALLSRLIYRMKKKFRRDKGFKSLEKVNKCLLRSLRLDLNSVVTITSRSAYDKNGPSREMLEWALVRLQAFAALFHRVYSTSLESASYMNVRLRDGHFWDVSLICTAVLSRIWKISSYLVSKACDWYSDLKFFLSELTSSGYQWLPEKYTLPESLETWLGNPSFIKVRSNRNLGIEEMLQEEEKSETKNVQAPRTPPPLFEGPISSEDLGDALRRKDYMIGIPKNPVDEITSAKKLLIFIHNEKEIRKHDKEACLTKNMNTEKWKEFEDYIYSNITRIRKLQDFRKMKFQLKQVREKIKSYLKN